MGGGNLEEEDYYHGLLPREDIPHLLIKEGDFLVRSSETAPNQPRQVIISILVEKMGAIVRHIVVQQNIHGKYVTDARASFHSVPELIQFYRNCGEPVLSTVPKAILKRAITRAPWELRHETVIIENKIGEGEFGEVFSGKYKLPTGRVVEVAIKLAKKAEMSKEKIKEMMKEARLMRNYEHPNVIRMYGVCVEHEPLLIVMELVDGGALDDFLKKNRVSVKDKIEKMVAGGAWGLEYLHSKNCIHRDIAARNCLLTRTGIVERPFLLHVKISDFGLSREGDEYQMTKARRVPIKWLAPETIQRLVYTSKTDVWSYGVMVWEIFANAAEPYPGMTNAEVKEKVTNGYKMLFAPEAPPWIVEIVHNGCWQLNPDRRANMGQIARWIEQNAGITAPVVITPPLLVTKSGVSGMP
ncbi:TK/FER protein kinase [Loa loa]|uniref:Tyrosine-protein kinase n=1 Tax=Loa loa TaxID=7209 RepID=A0A1S0U9R4_LOALO|nr:TK/FER protein kinase [Loa loa]EFO27420.1 TK/FER protein kinase [Loa loa]